MEFSTKSQADWKLFAMPDKPGMPTSVEPPCFEGCNATPTSSAFVTATAPLSPPPPTPPLTPPTAGVGDEAPGPLRDACCSSQSPGPPRLERESGEGGGGGSREEAEAEPEPEAADPAN